MIKHAALESVQAALGDGPAPVRRGPGRPRMKIQVGRPAKAAMSSGGKRSSEQVEAMAARVAEFVKSNPGARLETIASGLGTQSKELKLPVIKLLSSKTLKKTGEKRGTMYFAGGGHAMSKTKGKRKARRK